ncbi:MAG: type II toxin-antitoxin system VapC family toxin [Methylococcaceae bacterium]|nr:type II toxin-antitoxin system VapC family toxin [Methylococcaceae bacterium]
MVMLDTNICVYILKQHPINFLEKFQTLKEVYISSIVYAELCSGVTMSPEHLQTARQAQLVEFMALVTMQYWDREAAEAYAEVRAYLKAKGTPIGNMDMLIAAHALSLKALLVTNNVREFERVPNLNFENWVHA